MKSMLGSPLAGVALSLVAGLVTAAPAAQATLTLAQARAIALKTYPGKVVKQELEHEKGGSGLRYSFDVAGAKGTHEVGVDAVTGKLLENSDEAADND